MTTATSKPTDLIASVDLLAQQASSAEELMTAITKLLFAKLNKYNWVGFYMLEKGAVPPMLVLGPFQGAATPHTRIPLNQGICGAAASSGATVVVDDVNADPRYLACSLETKSEIVVPVLAKKIAAYANTPPRFWAVGWSGFLCGKARANEIGGE